MKWLVCIVLAVASLNAGTIGFFVLPTNAAAAAAAPGAITASGNTPVALAGLSAANLAGIDVLWILNPDNFGYDTSYTSNLGDISAFVSAGGILSFHDRAINATTTAGVLPGGGGITFVRNPLSTIDIQTAGTL